MAPRARFDAEAIVEAVISLGWTSVQAATGEVGCQAMTFECRRTSARGSRRSPVERSARLETVGTWSPDPGWPSGTLKHDLKGVRTPGACIGRRTASATRWSWRKRELKQIRQHFGQHQRREKCVTAGRGRLDTEHYPVLECRCAAMYLGHAAITSSTRTTASARRWPRIRWAMFT
jgi:hypothetical protein